MLYLNVLFYFDKKQWHINSDCIFQIFKYFYCFEVYLNHMGIDFWTKEMDLQLRDLLLSIGNINMAPTIEWFAELIGRDQLGMTVVNHGSNVLVYVLFPEGIFTN